MNEKILIVEDELQMLRLLGMTLQKEGYQIAVAQTAAAARSQIQAVAPDLIILDVMLPDVSGLDLCRELRQQRSTSSLPILMLSALGEVTHKVAGLKAGADEYVVKPIDAAELVARVVSLLERTRRLRGEGATESMVVSFLGSKGGVGTTTAMVNVAACLTVEGKRTIVVEPRAELGQLQTLLGLSAATVRARSSPLTRREFAPRQSPPVSGSTRPGSKRCRPPQGSNLTCASRPPRPRPSWRP